MNTLLLIILSTFIVSATSLVSIFSLMLKKGRTEKLIFYLVSLSVGALLGGAFLHLIPEAYEKLPNVNIFLFIIVGFLLFFCIEKFLHWHHCHKGNCKINPFAYMNLVGDGIHNFIDGMIVAVAYIASIPLGIITTFVIALHELPQEMGEFGVLVYAGYSKKKATFYNFLSGLTAIIGGIIGFFLYNYVDSLMIFILPIAAGGFLYIAASDLIPELKKEVSLKKSAISLLIVIIGISIMYFVRLLGSA